MLKLLLVDDEKYAINGLIQLLDWDRFDGTLIGTASSGEEALSVIEESCPDIIISDIKMGEMSGIDLAHAVQQKNLGIQIILLTAHGEFEYAKKAIRYGVIDYVLKPITLEKIEQLNSLLEQKREKLSLHRKTFMTVSDEDLKERLIDALRTKNPSALDDFFQSASYSELMLENNCDTIGVQLINYLYLYLQEISLDYDALVLSKKHTLETFLDMTSKQDKMDFIITKYYDFVTISSLQSKSHTHSIATYAMRYVSEHYTDPEFNLSSLSRAMHVSLSHLSTVFKQVTGTNLSTYVTQLRLDHAKKLLADMQYSIAELAFMSGYNDAKYFAKLFKKKNGISPSEYRDLIIQGDLYEP